MLAVLVIGADINLPGPPEVQLLKHTNTNNLLKLKHPWNWFIITAQERSQAQDLMLKHF